MSEGLKLIAACIADDKPGILLKLNRDVLIDGPETQAYDYTIQHYREFRSLPQAATIQEQTGVRVGTAREPAEYYETNCYNRYASSRAKQIFPRLREALEGTTTEDIRATEEAARQILNELRAVRPAARTHSIQTVSREIVQRLRNTAFSPRDLTGITTGWPEMDAITGGYQDSDLVFWVARPAMGKTYYLLWQIWAAIQAGHRVILGTTEMSAEQIGRRLVAIALGINPTVLRSGRVSSYDLRRISQLQERMLDENQLIIQELGFQSSISEMEALCDDMRPDVVYIDGIYMLKPVNVKFASRTEKVANVADDLKVLALTSHIPVICTTQFNRSAGKGGREGSLETVGMSDSLVQNGSLVIRIAPCDNIDSRNAREVEFLKGREGEYGTLNMHYKFSPLNFSVIGEDEILETEGVGM